MYRQRQTSNYCRPVSIIAKLKLTIVADDRPLHDWLETDDLVLSLECDDFQILCCPNILSALFLFSFRKYSVLHENIQRYSHKYKEVLIKIFWSSWKYLVFTEIFKYLRLNTQVLTGIFRIFETMEIVFLYPEGN